MSKDRNIIYYRDLYYYTVMFADANGNENGNGNGIMKTPQRETVVSLGFTEDPIPPNSYCCNSCHIQVSSHIKCSLLLVSADSQFSDKVE